MTRRQCITRAVGLVLVMGISAWGLALPGYAEDKKGVRIDDLPAPMPQALEKIKEVGNEVGKGISKATGAAGEGVNKAIKGRQDKK